MVCLFTIADFIPEISERGNILASQLGREYIQTMKKSIVLLCGGFLLAVYPSAAQATLGEPASAVETTGTAPSAAQRAAQTRNGYTTREIKTDAATVREFITPSGIVFGISWRGMAQPDLTSQLGGYADEYRKAAQKAPRQRGKRHHSVKAAGVVVEKWGHMRDMQGRAYVPSLMPPGVNADEIK